MNKSIRIALFALGILILGMVLITQVAPKLAPQAAPLATATSSPPASVPFELGSIEDFYSVIQKIIASPATQAQAQADELWQFLVDSQRVPLVLAEHIIFLYKGEAQRVEWYGVFNNWGEPGLEGNQIGETDLWYQHLAAPVASRIEYKIVLNGQEWILDPANPDTQMSGLTGENSILTMPGFTVTDESQMRSEVKAGTLTGDLIIDSQSLGYAVNYRVYLPVGYEEMQALPVLYVLDGNDFADERMGALPTILDNLIADGRIDPVVVVFVDSRQPGNLDNNRREIEFLLNPEMHALFITAELVPEIDRAFRTDPQPEARTIMGVSYGGLSAIYIAASQSAVFHNIAAFSPSLWVLDSPQYLPDPQYVEGSQKMLGPTNAATVCGGDTAIPCPRLPIKVFLTTGIPGWDVGDFSILVQTLVDQNYPVEFHKTKEGHSWSAWRGLSDEMLIYFFGSD